MNSPSFIELIISEADAIKQAPLTFSTALALVIGLTWVVINYLYRNKIESLEGRLKLKEDQVSDYKEKLKGDTPDQAKARLDTLEAQTRAIRNELDALGEVDLAAKFEEALKTANVTIDGGTF